MPSRRASGPRALCLLLGVLVQGCAALGPAGVEHGRPTYNAVINASEDQQILSMIVRRRYDETFGLLAVSSVTASLRASASLGANAGIGSRGAYEGNLVPFSAGAVYEENPTISYVPVRGEQFIERMLAPVSAEQALLLGRMSTGEVEVLRMLVRRANGIANPLFSSRPPRDGGAAFDRFVELYARLRELGRLDVVGSGEGQYQLLLHDFSEEESALVGELLATLGVRRASARGPIALPLRFFVGEPRADSVDLETPSALEIIEAAGRGVEVPAAHRADGVASESATPQGSALLAIRSSQGRPSHASVAVAHRGWWFFVDERDAKSKQAFMILRTLIGLRLDESGNGLPAPVLTLPVAR